MARLAGNTIGLDGVPEQQANYASMGFVPAYESIRLSGRPSIKQSGVDVTEGVDPEAALNFDTICFPAEREAFLSAWLALPRIVRATVKGGVLDGYGAIRPCLEGFKVGPLFCQQRDAALTILAFLVDTVDGPVQLDVPLSDPTFADALLGAGMAPSFSTARMYRGPAPAVDMTKVFAVTTLELG